MLDLSRFVAFNSKDNVSREDCLLELVVTFIEEIFVLLSPPSSLDNMKTLSLEESSCSSDVSVTVLLEEALFPFSVSETKSSSSRSGNSASTPSTVFLKTSSESSSISESMYSS